MKILAKGLFILGIISAVAIGLLIPSSTKFFGIPLVVVMISFFGVFIGIINLRNSKTNSFLVTTILLLALGNAGLLSTRFDMLEGVIINILAFVGPCALLVSIKAIVEMVMVK